MTDTLTITGKLNCTTGNMLSAFTESMEVSPMDFKLFPASIDQLLSGIGVKVKFEPKLSISAVGNFTVVLKYRSGTKISLGSQDYTRELIEKKMDGDLVGSITLGLENSLAISAPGLGDVIKFSADLGITVATKDLDDYDPDIDCFEENMTLTVSMSCTFKLAIDLASLVGGEGLSWTFVTKTAQLFPKWEMVIAKAHVERIRGDILPSNL